MAQLFALHPTLMLLLFTALGIASYAMALAVHTYFGRGQPGDSAAIPVPNFAATITTAWAFAIGFSAAEIWSVSMQAKQATASEHSAIARLAGVAAPRLLDDALLSANIQSYAAAVLDYEAGASAGRSAREVDTIIEDIREDIFRLAVGGVPDPIIGKITLDFDQLQDARAQRVAIATAPVSDYKWYLVFVLTVLSQIALATVHADRRRGGRRALAIFTIAATVSICLLAQQANPYAAGVAIEFDALLTQLSGG